MRWWLFVLVAACSSHKDDAPKASPDPWAASPPQPAKPKVELVTPGTAPRRALAYDVKSVDRTVAIDFAIGQLRTAIDVTWRCTPDCSYAVTRFDIGDHPDEAISKLAKTVIGVVRPNGDGGYYVVPTTIVRMMPSITELLRMSIVQFPAQPVGVGARWSIVEDDARRTYAIVAIDGARVTVDVDLTYKGADGMSGSDGHGRLEVSLADPIAKGTITSTIGGEDDIPREDMTITVK